MIIDELSSSNSNFWMNIESDKYCLYWTLGQKANLERADIWEIKKSKG